MADQSDNTTREAPPGVRAPAGRSVLRVMGEQAPTTFVLPAAGAVVIGRGDDVDLRVDDPSISRRHAVLHVTDDDGPAFQIEDLDSANGTHLRGVALRPGERVGVRPGEVIELGTALCMVQAPPRSEGAPRPAARDEAHARKTGPDDESPPEVVIVDPAMRQLHALLPRVARGTIHVLLLGETGVGKEVFAARLHALSPRASGPFVKLNCAAFSETLIESELFGYEKGAFTGAAQPRAGLIESADGGTVFLDEVGELSAGLQAKLLRVLEERVVRRVGALKERAVDVRFVAATNRDLESEAEHGRFREDLYFRLNGFALVIPPLRERVGEIAPLALWFVARAARAAGRPSAPALSREALAVLERHRWPGNLRELRNAMERAVLLADDVIGPEHLPVPRASSAPAPSNPPSSAPVSAPAAPPEAPAEAPVETIEKVREAAEREHILSVLERCGGNQTRAAKLLGLSRRALINRLEAYDLPRPRK